MLKISECAKLVATLKDDLRPKTLKLAFNELKDEGAIVISRFLTQFPTLTCLDLGFNDIGDAGTEALANSLASNSTLKILHLSGNAITDVGFRFLANALCENRTLSSLYLTGNSGGTGGAAALAESLLLNTTVEVLCFNGNNIKERGAVSISEMLKINSTITHLNLSDNSMGDVGIKAVADSLLYKRNLENLACSFNNITADGIQSLCVTLQGYTNMKRLLLDNNRIGIKGAKILSEILPSLRLVELNIGFNDIKAEGLISIVKCLVDNTVLESLTLSGNVLDGDVSRLIAYMLVHNTVLKKLYLDRTNMSQSSEKNIAAGIASSKSSSLKTLTGFSLGFVLTTLGSPQKLETYTNDQVLRYLEDMWKLQKQAEIEKYEDNKRRVTELQAMKNVENIKNRKENEIENSSVGDIQIKVSPNIHIYDGMTVGIHDNNDYVMNNDQTGNSDTSESSGVVSPIVPRDIDLPYMVINVLRSDTISTNTTKDDNTIETSTGSDGSDRSGSSGNITDCSEKSDRLAIPETDRDREMDDCPTTPSTTHHNITNTNPTTNAHPYPNTSLDTNTKYGTYGISTDSVDKKCSTHDRSHTSLSSSLSNLNTLSNRNDEYPFSIGNNTNNTNNINKSNEINSSFHNKKYIPTPEYHSGAHPAHPAHPLESSSKNVSEHFEGYCEADMMKRFSYAGLCELDRTKDGNPKERDRLSLGTGGPNKGEVDEVECSEELFCLVDSALSDPEVVCVLDSDLKLYYNHSLSYHRLHVDSDIKNMNNCIIDGRDALNFPGEDDSPLNCSILNRNLLDISHSDAGCWNEGLYHKSISIHTGNTAINGDNGITGSEGRRPNNSTSTIPSFTSSNFLDKMKKRKLNNYRHEVSEVPNQYRDFSLL